MEEEKPESKVENGKMWRRPIGRTCTRAARTSICIISDRCKGCGFCIEFCPRKVLAWSENFNVKGYHPPVAQNPGACVDCDLCEIICPEFAIYTTKETGGEGAGEVE